MTQIASAAPALYSRTVNGYLIEIVETGRPKIRYQVYSQPVGSPRTPLSPNWGHKTRDAADKELLRRAGVYGSMQSPPSAAPVVEPPFLTFTVGAHVTHPALGTCRVLNISRDQTRATVKARGRAGSSLVKSADLTLL